MYFFFSFWKHVISILLFYCLFLQNEFHLKINFLMQLFEENATVDESIAIVDSIRGINLSNNNLESLQNSRFPDGLRHLFLHNNKLKKMPSALLREFSELRKVSLSGNPWSCDCDSVNFRRCILSNEEIVSENSSY